MDEAPASEAEKPAPPARAPVRRRSYWLPAVVLGVAIHGAAFLVLGVSSGHREPRREYSPGLKWVGERASAEIELRDPKPIFLPTRWNATVPEVSETDQRVPGEIFGLEQRPPLLAKASSPLGLVAPVVQAQTASAATQRFSRPYFSAFGQQDVRRQPLPARVAGIEIRDATAGDVVLQWEFGATEAAELGVDTRRWPPWEPFELLIAVEPSGMVGLPLVAFPGSNAEVVDDFFRSQLRAMRQLHLLLPAGYYRVVIGP